MKFPLSNVTVHFKEGKPHEYVYTREQWEALAKRMLELEEKEPVKYEARPQLADRQDHDSQKCQL